jgi:dTDP-4-amino-4,6-dideoxygalactose transaminase
MPSHYYFDPASSHWATSRATLGIIGRVDPSRIVVRRRSNFTHLLARIANVPDVTPLFSALPPRVCPLEFPLLVEDRDDWIARLAAHRVAALPWWAGYHRDLPWDDFPEACALKDRVLALPVNQDLDSAAMDYVAAAVAAVASSRRAEAGGVRSAR